jgi:FixJ family two-component response regulator
MDIPHGGVGPIERVADQLTLTRALGRLSRREREAVVLRMVWDLSVREAAGCMGVSPRAVKRYCADGLFGAKAHGSFSPASRKTSPRMSRRATGASRAALGGAPGHGASARSYPE